MCEEVQAKLGTGLSQALGPKAEGAELKIAGWLWQPPALARPSGTAAHPRPRPGYSGTLSPLPSHPSQDITPTPTQEAGVGDQVAGAAPTRHGLCSSCPPLFLPQALSPGPQDGGVSEVPKPGAPATPSCHLRAGGLCPPCPPLFPLTPSQVPNLSLLSPTPAYPPGTVRR